MYNGATEDTPDKAQQGLLTERGMPPCILLIASCPALRERDIGTASMGEAVKIEPVLEARKLDRTVCLRAFSIPSPEMYPKACSRQNEKIELHRPSLFPTEIRQREGGRKCRRHDIRKCQSQEQRSARKSIIVPIAALPQQRRLWDGEAPSYSSAVSNT